MYKENFSVPEMNIVDSVSEFAKHGYRTLAFATRRLVSDNVDELTQDEIECKLTMVGVTSVEDLL